MNWYMHVYFAPFTGIWVSAPSPRCRPHHNVVICYFQVQLLHPQPGWVELDPHILWDQFVDIITEVMEGRNLMSFLPC